MKDPQEFLWGCILLGLFPKWQQRKVKVEAPGEAALLWTAPGMLNPSPAQEPHPGGDRWAREAQCQRLQNGNRHPAPPRPAPRIQGQQPQPGLQGLLSIGDLSLGTCPLQGLLPPRLPVTASCHSEPGAGPHQTCVSVSRQLPMGL